MNDFDFYDTYRIPQALSLLPYDNYYHNIDFTYKYSLNQLGYNKNIFKIDDNIFFYYSSVTSSISTSSTFTLYMSSPLNNGISAIASNICVTLLKEQLGCGNTVSGDLTLTGDWGYYRSYNFNLTKDSSVLFDTCGSLFDSELSLYDISNNLLYFVDEGDCGNQAQLSVPLLYAGKYRVEIRANYMEDIGWYQIRTSCDEISNNSAMYQISPIAGNTWYESELICESRFGTTLATIVSEQDACAAEHIINLALSRRYDVSLYIGLYRDAGNGSKWQWVDETSCDYTETGLCGDDHRWYDKHSQYNQEQSISYLTMPAATSANNNVSMINFLSTAGNDNEIYVNGAFCNSINSKHNIRNCSQRLRCWIRIENCCNNSNLTEDTASIPGIYQPQIAYWASKLFVIGIYNLHYANINIPGADLVWEQGEYNIYNFSIINLMQIWCQYESSLYLYMHDDGNNSWVILDINLDDLSDIVYYPVPGDVGFLHCMVASREHLYIVGFQTTLTYNMIYSTWEITAGTGLSQFQLTATCSLTTNFKYIYMFMYLDYGIFRYDTTHRNWDHINTPNLCNVPYPFYFNEGQSFPRVGAPSAAVASNNGKIYLHGCHISSWKTLAFDPNTETFEAKTIDIDYVTDIPNYRGGQITLFDDNVLLMLYATNPEYPIRSIVSKSYGLSLFYALTELISINFMETTEIIETTLVWPSEGFTIKYRFNDFNEVVKGLYHVYFQNVNPPINAIVELNKSDDHCICNETSYDCYQCSQHFELGAYLSTQDNDEDELLFNISTNLRQTLILPASISIKLIRCSISFNYINKSTTYAEPNIVFQYSLSPSCYFRHNISYLLNITAPAVNLSSQLIVVIIDNDTKTTLLCYNNHFATSDCSYFDGNIFIISHETKNIENQPLHLLFQSNMIDYRVYPSNHTIQYFALQTEFHIRVNYTMLLLLIVPFSIICFIAMYCKKQYQNAYVVHKALVLIIGIEKFDDEHSLLSGVTQNIADLTNLWENRYNYDLFVCNRDVMYISKADVIEFIDTHKTKITSGLYQCVIVHIISHGVADGFYCSDGKKCTIGFISHELITEEEMSDNTSILKLVFHHGCRGVANYSDGVPNLSAMSSNIELTSTVHRGYNVHTSIDANNDEVVSHDANFIIISGNIEGRTMSDDGHFTKCICISFEKNLKRWIKADFNSLFVEISNNLEEKTNHAELCNINGTPRFNPIRFERCQDKSKTQSVDERNAYDYVALE
eukprot:137973_1